jgi:hypothetical protein
MPLKITNPVQQVAVLNKWADGIEDQLSKTVQQTSRAAQSVAVVTQTVANLPPASVSLEAGNGISIAGTDPYIISSLCIPRPNYGVYFQARAILGQNSFQTIGDASTAAQNGGSATISTATPPTSTEGVVIPLTLGNGSVNGYNGWFPINEGSFWAGRNCRYQARIQTVPAGGNICYFGFTNATPSSMRTVPPGATYCVAFYTPGVGITDTWHAAINGLTQDTGISVTYNEVYLEIIMDDTANTTSFAINGGTPLVISGHNLSGAVWWPTATFSQTTDVAQNFGVGYFYGEQSF